MCSKSECTTKKRKKSEEERKRRRRKKKRRGRRRERGRNKLEENISVHLTYLGVLWQF